MKLYLLMVLIMVAVTAGLLIFSPGTQAQLAELYDSNPCGFWTVLGVAFFCGCLMSLVVRLVMVIRDSHINQSNIM